MDKEVRKKRHLSQTQFIAYGFFAIILIGALLLMLPIANRGGKNLGFINCLLTATSATCVTGLVAADTWSQWTLFGQMVILAMIQIGGLGFITIGVFVSIILRRRVSSVSYTHLRAHETKANLVCRLLLEKNFFNDTATTEIYTYAIVGSVRCV